MLKKIKSFFIETFNMVVEARKARAKAFVEYYKRTGHFPNWD